MGHRTRGKAPSAIPAAAGERCGVGGADMGRLQFRQRQSSQRREVLAAQLGVALMRPGRYLPLHVLDPALEESGDRHAGGDVGAVLQIGDQAGSLYLRLALRASEAVPAPLALTGLRIARVDDDGPVTGGAFADVALHLFSPMPSVFSDGVAVQLLLMLN